MRQIPLNRSNKLPDDDGVAVYLSRKEIEAIAIALEITSDLAECEPGSVELLVQFNTMMLERHEHVEKPDSNPHDYDVRFRSGSPAVPPTTPEEDSRPAADSGYHPHGTDALPGGTA